MKIKEEQSEKDKSSKEEGASEKRDFWEEFCSETPWEPECRVYEI